MTTITDSFFAPKRDMEVRNTAKKATWRSLLVSSSVHVLGFVLVVFLSQYSLEKRRDYIQTQPNQTPIKAALYFPTTVTKVVEDVEDTVPSKVEVQDAPQPQKTTSKKEEISEIKQQPKKTNNAIALPVQPKRKRYPLQTQPRQMPINALGSLISLSKTPLHSILMLTTTTVLRKKP
ncbi:hypothetical protein [Alteromonas gracilis]|uniref:hypothetical protein n=1 Tax=Alteromonas gracilis TaxID=1479524 RepID=UPI00321B0FC7